MSRPVTDVTTSTAGRPAHDGSPALASIQILNGDATPAEVAAIVVALTAIAAGAPAEAPVRSTSNWAAPVRGLRAAHRPGPGRWRASSLPH